MSSNFIIKISPMVRIISLAILIFGLLITKSIYLILFITTLTLLLCLVSGKKVNLYVKAIKNVLPILLIFLLAYIIILKRYDIFSVLLLIYQIINITILIKILFLNINFIDLYEGLYGIFFPVEKMNINIKKLCLDVSLAIYFIKFLIESKENIKFAQKLNGKSTLNIKNYFLPRIIYATNKLDLLKENLKIKFYNFEYKKSNFKSKIVLIIFTIFLILLIFKEVI